MWIESEGFLIFVIFETGILCPLLSSPKLMSVQRDFSSIPSQFDSKTKNTISRSCGWGYDLLLNQLPATNRRFTCWDTRTPSGPPVWWLSPPICSAVWCVCGTQYVTDLLSVVFLFMRFEFHMRMKSLGRWQPRKSLVFWSLSGERAAAKCFIIFFYQHLMGVAYWVRINNIIISFSKSTQLSLRTQKSSVLASSHVEALNDLHQEIETLHEDSLVNSLYC